MKGLSIFAEFTPRTFSKNEYAVAIFMAIRLRLSAKIKGCRTTVGYCIRCCNLFLAERGAIALLILFTSIFCYMPRTTENASNAQGAATSTSNGTKSDLTQYFSPEFIQFIDQLKDMRLWFIDYEIRNQALIDCIETDLNSIQNELGSIVCAISNLAANELQDRIFFAPTDSKMEDLLKLQDKKQTN